MLHKIEYLASEHFIHWGVPLDTVTHELLTSASIDHFTLGVTQGELAAEYFSLSDFDN